MRKLSLQTCAGLCLLCAFISPRLNADPIAWKPGVFGFWSNGADWNGGGAIPQNGVGAAHWDVTIASGIVGQNLPGVSIDSLALFDPAVLNINPGNSLSSTSLTGSGALDIFNGAQLNIQDASGFNGKIGLLNASGITSAAPLTELNLGGGSLNSLVQLGGAPGHETNLILGMTGLETIANNVLITASEGQIGNMATFLNAGSIETTGYTSGATTLAGNLKISTYSFLNTGLVQVDSLSSLNIVSPHFQNFSGGTFSGGTWDLSGQLSFTGADIGTIGAGTDITLRTEGSISDGASNALRNLGVNNGSLTVTGAGANLTLASTSIENTGRLAIDQGASFNAGYVRNDLGANLTVGEDGASSLNGRGLINAGTVAVERGTADFRDGGHNTFTNLDASTETLSGGSYILGRGTLIYDSGTGVHGGEILHIGSATSVTLYGAGLFQYGPSGADALAQLNSNAGTLSLLSDSHTFTPADGTFVNSGEMNVLLLGTEAHVNGNFANTDTGFAIVRSGSLNVSAGFVNNGGSVEISNGGSLHVGLALNNDGDVAVDGTFTANNIVNTGTFKVQSESPSGAQASVSSVFENRNGGSVTVGTAAGPGLDTLSGNDFQNNGGSLDIEAMGLVSFTGSFTQTGGETVLNGGTIMSPDISIQGGDITGHGVLVGDTDNSGGNVHVDGGLIETDGNYTQDAGGTLTEDLTSGNILDVHGDVTLGGQFDGLFLTPTTFTLGDTFRILEFDGSITGDFGVFILPTLADGLMFREVRSAGIVSLEVDAAMASSSAPEPAGMFTMGTGLLVIGMFLRRRRRQRTA